MNSRPKLPGRRSRNGTALTRRDLLAQGLLLGAATFGCGPGPQPVPPEPPPPEPPPPEPPPPEPPAALPIRRNIVALASGDPTLAAFREAVRLMKALPASDRRSWQNQALIHENFCPHGNWLFLPWHRAYLHFFEQICKELVKDESFALPYWNWTLNRNIPAAFWDDPATNPLFHPGRTATAASQTGPSTNVATLLDILGETNFQLFGSGAIPSGGGQRESVFYGPLEGVPHNYVHGFVGGDMGTFMSPLDPIFWCHHNMIEALWYEWNIRRENQNPNNADWTGHVFTEFCDRKGQPVQVNVADTLLYPLAAYQFDPLVLSPDVVPRDVTPPSGPLEASVRARVTRGAPSAMPLGAMSVLGERKLIPVGRGVSVGTRDAAAARRSGASRPLIRLSGVAPIMTGEIVARVFVNKPDASAATPADAREYVGSIAFFSHPHGPAPQPLTFYLDATRALRDGESVSSVQVVPVPYEGRSTRIRQLEIGRIEVGVLP